MSETLERAGQKVAYLGEQLKRFSSKSTLKGGTRLVIAVTVPWWAFLLVYIQQSTTRHITFTLLFPSSSFRRLFLDEFWSEVFFLNPTNNEIEVDYGFVLFCAFAVPLFFLGVIWLIRWTIRGFKSSGF
jgi:hypothetical protein